MTKQDATGNQLLVSAATAAAKLGCSREALVRRIATHAIPGAQVGRRWFVLASALDIEDRP